MARSTTSVSFGAGDVQATYFDHLTGEFNVHFEAAYRVYSGISVSQMEAFNSSENPYANLATLGDNFTEHDAPVPEATDTTEA